ncbi:response regulator [Larkinella arboricola]|uniref:CheY-like chemotaxis protein n=1 Tax=Larkinella arboricola TaxID=643671 RepID=A0A327WRY3_LARAB|nr:response regulator [Larkinella arboricola]RAJ94062.1 CheY-like chemotaxis protein [Larkinella arboricola]
MTNRPFIAVVDDDEDDLFLIQEAFKSCLNEENVILASSGVDLLLRLETVSILPSFLLLDLNMPQMSGFDVLTRLRSDPRYTLMPVLIFSTSNAQPDVDRAYELGANSYVKKPASFADYKSVVEDLCNFWLRVASTPSSRIY